MKRTSLFLFAISSTMLFSCVSMRKYQDLEKNYNEAVEKNKNCNTQLETANADRKTLTETNLDQEKTIGRLRTDSIEISSRLKGVREDYVQLKDSYETLLKNTETQNQKMGVELKSLEDKLNRKELELNRKEADLAEKEKSINDLQTSLKQNESELKKKEQKVAELQKILSSKDSAVNALKNSMTKALLGFKDNGLSVEIKNGKVYVSMEEKLLFPSASIVVNAKGKEALDAFAKAINSQPDAIIMIEGHTDDVPIKSGQIKDNWDLSVLRATSIVRYLVEEAKVDPKRIIASGRGENLPVAEGKTTEARAKNRRTEIILTPKLDELFKILGN